MAGKRLGKILFAILCLLSVIARCQQKDSIFLRNGQVLIGDIKNVKYGKITIDDVDLKLISVKLYKVKTIKSNNRLKITTDDKDVYIGTLTSDNRDGWTIIIASTGEKTALKITSISTIIFLEKEFFKRLDGNIGAGFSFTKSSGIGQVNLNTTISYVAKNFENQLKASTIGSIDSSKYSRDNENIEIYSQYDFTSSWLASGLLAYQRNLELSLARRFQEMIGGGNKLLVRSNLEFLVISGITFNQEKSTENVKSGLLLEVPIMARFNYFNFQHPNIQISTSQTLFFGLTQKGRVRFNGSTDFSWELVRDFSFTLNFYNNFDSRPPVTAPSKTDFGVVMGLSYKF
jgi:hypothetical protein